MHIHPDSRVLYDLIFSVYVVFLVFHFFLFKVHIDLRLKSRALIKDTPAERRHINSIVSRGRGQ